MKLCIIQFAQANIQEFVAFWKLRYSYPNAVLYDDNIGQPLDPARVWKLYQWKNGTSEISAKKKQSIETTYIAALGNLPTLKTVQDGKQYIGSLGGGGIWDIFWLHCLAPSLFPIFDQHTYRAMAQIEHGTTVEIPTSRDKKLTAYFDQYLPFLDRFGTVERREIDQALFAYGRFLKTAFAKQ